MMKKRFAVYLNMEGKKTVVCGNDGMAGKIVRDLVACGSDVTVITEKPSADLKELADSGKIRLLRKPYRREMILDAFMVFAWSDDPAVNEDLYAACSCLGIPVTVKDHPEKSRFFTEPGAAEPVKPGAAEPVKSFTAEPSGSDVPEKTAETVKKTGRSSAPGKYDGDDSAIPESISAVIYTDGAARGNPDGPGGYGVVLCYRDADGNPVRKEYSQGYIRTTNNRMELMAAIVGLEKLKGSCDVVLHSDSQYLIKAFNDHWIEGWIRRGWVNSQRKPVKNRDLWERLLKAAKPHRIRFVWVKGHNGDPLNERCDELATSAADGDHLIPDPGVSAGV